MEGRGRDGENVSEVCMFWERYYIEHKEWTPSHGDCTASVLALHPVCFPSPFRLFFILLCSLSLSLFLQPFNDDFGTPSHPLSAFAITPRVTPYPQQTSRSSLFSNPIPNDQIARQVDNLRIIQKNSCTLSLSLFLYVSPHKPSRLSTLRSTSRSFHPVILFYRCPPHLINTRDFFFRNYDDTIYFLVIFLVFFVSDVYIAVIVSNPLQGLEVSLTRCWNFFQIRFDSIIY